MTGRGRTNDAVREDDPAPVARDAVARLLADGVPLRRERVSVPAADLERIHGNLRRGVDCWVAAVVVDERGRALLVRNRWSDGWVPPGGSVEPDEPPRDAAVREVREETGVAVTVREPLAVVEETFECGDRAAWGHRVVYAAATEAPAPAVADDPGLDGEGIEAAAWFDDLPGRVEYRGLVERGRGRRG